MVMKLTSSDADVAALIAGVRADLKLGYGDAKRIGALCDAVECMTGDRADDRDVANATKGRRCAYWVPSAPAGRSAMNIDKALILASSAPAWATRSHGRCG
jgi:hypothetical protein